LNKNEPTEDFATNYLLDAKNFLKSVEEFRNKELAGA